MKFDEDLGPAGRKRAPDGPGDVQNHLPPELAAQILEREPLRIGDTMRVDALGAALGDADANRVVRAIDELYNFTVDARTYIDFDTARAIAKRRGREVVYACEATDAPYEAAPRAPDALEDIDRELLTCLAEECAEVIQRVTKILRFGLRHNPWTGEHNRETLESEMGDIRAFERLLDHRGVMSGARAMVHANAKLVALAKPDGRLRAAHATATDYQNKTRSK